MSTLALVHGGHHGAWCWELLAPLLRRADHDVIAMDLPCENSSASFDTYADVVCAALNGCDGDVVLVGHSVGGHTIPLVAARRPVRHVVYLCALVPDAGRSLLDQQRAESDMLSPLYAKALERDAQSRYVWVDSGLARRLLYADCDDATAQAAINRLRPQAVYPSTLPFSLAEFPPVPNTYVVCTDDQMVGPEWSKRVARDRLDAEIIELPGSHSPFLSRPSALADVLLRLADER